MNQFDEDKWPVAQRNIDAQITADFDSIQASFANAESSGVPVEKWLADSAESASTLRAAVGLLDHAGRKAHWASELARLGFAPAPVPAIEIVTFATPEVGMSKTITDEPALEVLHLAESGSLRKPKGGAKDG